MVLGINLEDLLVVVSRLEIIEELLIKLII